MTVYWNNKWWAIWNANTVEEEGEPGQKIYGATGTESGGKINWSNPSAIFTGATSSPGSVLQWQPGMAVKGSELWVLWHQIGGVGAEQGVYWSKKALAGNGSELPWTSVQLKFDSEGSSEPQIYPTIGGIEWRVYPASNPVMLSNGRFCVPVTLVERGKPFSSKQTSNTSQIALKRNAMLYKDNSSSKWKLSGTVTGEGWSRPARCSPSIKC